MSELNVSTRRCTQHCAADISTWLHGEDLALVATPPRARSEEDERDLVFIHRYVLNPRRMADEQTEHCALTLSSGPVLNHTTLHAPSVGSLSLDFLLTRYALLL